MSEAPYRVETLGQRLDRQARHLAGRCVPDCPWAAPLMVLLEHLADLPSPTDSRFTRTEVAPAEVGQPAWPQRRAGPVAHYVAAEQELPPELAALLPPLAQPAWAVRPAWPQQRPEPGAYRTEVGRPLPPDVAGQLRARVGPGATAMRVHDGDEADAIAVGHRADAVTIGADVFFQRGRLRPREAQGFGLLVHEATHVVERLRPDAAVRRASGIGVEAEERAALAAETAAQGPAVASPTLQGPHRPPTTLAPVPTPTAPVGASPLVAAPHGVTAPAPVQAGAGALASVASRPMAAATDRPAPGALDVDALRSTLMRDLMRQLRDEFERGG